MADCNETFLHLDEYLDNEVDEVTIAEIRVHLKACPECDDVYQVRALVKQVVYRTCVQETAPEALYESIMVRLRSIDQS